MPVFIEPELCRVVAVPASGSDWVHEVKFDGYRMQLRVARKGARLRTRRGLDWTERFPEIAHDAETLPDCMIDGEIVALNDKHASDFAALQQALSDARTGKLIFFAFDLLFCEGRDLRNEPLSTRKDALEALLRRRARGSSRVRFVGHLASHGGAVLKAACRMGLEGVISKRVDSPYRSGRGDAWTKAKCRGGQEVVIGGWWGDSKTLRSLLVGAYRGKDFLFMGGVGTGFNAHNAAEVLEALRPLEQKQSPFTGTNKPPHGSDIRWVKPKVVAEVEFSNFTSTGMLRQASFKGLREDKLARSVVVEPAPGLVEKNKKEKTMARALLRADPPKIRSGEPEVAGVRISNADKQLWPASKTTEPVTKLDLAQFYERIASRILPHLEGRPLSVVRAPDGIGGQHFFQRHALVGPFGAIKVKGETKPFLMVDNKEALVALAQAGVLEMHPWGSKKDEPETPDRLIFDLDPAPDVKFDRVVATAKEMRERLAKLGLEPFVKTTGGKGLHVVTPIKGSQRHTLTWPIAKNFAQALCKLMEQDSPNRYTTTIAKKARGGKIFLDYLRNDHFATAVAPWSPRARLGAPVAVPLEWSKMRAGLDPARFHVGNAVSWLKAGDPWKDLGKSAVPLEAAIRRLTQR